VCPFICRISDGTTEVESSIIFNIQDINDNYPQFNPDIYSIDVKESTAIG
jgi:hypothetical protein